MRLFFGLELDQRTVLRVADWRDRQFPLAVRPVPPANFHITLAFVGELPAAALEGLCLSVDDSMAQSPVPGAGLTLDQIGYWHKPGIYWLGPRAWPTPLDTLSDKLKGLACSAGARRDKRAFQPHVTLFRRCADAPPAPAIAPAFVLDYQHFTLFESRQGKNAVGYHPLQEWDLPATA